MLPTKRRYWMMEYDQSWFERMWYKRHDLLFQDLWVKEFRMSRETFEFVVELVRENIRNIQQLLEMPLKLKNV